jgi:hypothetical protein
MHTIAMVLLKLKHHMPQKEPTALSWRNFTGPFKLKGLLPSIG